MYTIGQVSKKFNLPISTLRYYDKEGLFPDLKRISGIRMFSEREMETLKVIECLKKSNLEIKAIRQFMMWCCEGNRTYQLRKDLFEMQKQNLEKEITKMEQTLAMIKYKCWYYEQAQKDGHENNILKMIPNNLPCDIQILYDKAHEED